jgi:YbbR domain-containing protein
MWRWLGRNLSTLLLAFLLAVVVWFSAVLSTDPNVEAVYPRALDLQVLGQDPGFMQVEKIPLTVRLTLNAPQSIWNELNANQDALRVWIDLSGLGEGKHVVPIKTQIQRYSPVQVVKIEPAEIEVTLEQRVARTFTIQTNISGDPSLGYRKGVVQIDPTVVTVSGPRTLADRVVSVQVDLDVTGANDTVSKAITVQPVDQNGVLVPGLNVTPPTVQVTQAVSLLGGYRNVVVKVVTTGQVADGYWLTNVSVSPPNVTVFSTDPTQVNLLPGFVETNPLDLIDLRDDVDIRATLNLPAGVSLAGEESVLVRLSIAALEGSLPITLPLEVVGLTPEYRASLSPEKVDLLLTGPLPLLNNLTPGGIRVSVSLSGLEPGIHQVTPVVDLLPGQVSVASILPESVEVTIELNSNGTTIASPSPTVSQSATSTPTP